MESRSANWDASNWKEDWVASNWKEELMSDNFGKSGSKPGMRLTWRGVVIIVIAVVLLVFAVQNLETAQVKFLGMDFDIYVWLIVTVSFLLGMLLGGVVRGTARKLRKPKPQVSK